MELDAFFVKHQLLNFFDAGKLRNLSIIDVRLKNLNNL